jgi:hypothetical protein
VTVKVPLLKTLSLVWALAEERMIVKKLPSAAKAP